MRISPRIGSLAVIGLAAAGCANNVPQDRSTGPDGKIKGAKPIALEEGEGKVRGVVTYPGGDRVDWKLIELPEGKKGQLDLEMKFTTPRPGLQVSFDVFDQWNTPVAAAKGARRTRTTSIDNAKGKYFVRIYAPKRGDAGKYILAASFHEFRPPPPIPQVEIPNPPTLANVPEPVQACTSFDKANKECEKTCAFDAPKGWPACADRDKAAQIAEDKERQPPPPPPPVAPKPLTGRFIKHVVNGDSVDLTVAYGAKDGVTDQWKARLLRGDTSSPLSNGQAKIIRINNDSTILRVKLTPDIVMQNRNVVLEP